MTLSWDSAAEYEREMEKERNPAIDSCCNCGLEIHEQDWTTDTEGARFCDNDCKKNFLEETFDEYATSVLEKVLDSSPKDSITYEIAKEKLEFRKGLE